MISSSKADVVWGVEVWDVGVVEGGGGGGGGAWGKRRGKRSHKRL